MPDTDIKITKVYGGPFVWEETGLHSHAAQFDLHYIGHYTAKDPQTWPVIRDIKLENGKDYRKSQTPPPYVAYDATLMADLVKQRPMSKTVQQCSEGQGDEQYFRKLRLYPFNFSRQNFLWKTEHIPHDEFKFWMRLWEKMLASIEVEQEASASPYVEIMTVLCERDTTPQDALAKMQAELKAVQTQLQATQTKLLNAETSREYEATVAKRANERAAAAEKEAKETAARLKQQERCLEDSEERAATAISDCEELEKEVEELIVEVAKLKAQLMQAQGSVATLQNQLAVSEQNHAQTKK